MTYKVVMMGGSEIKIDKDEIPNVLQALKTGNPCMVKQGIFNPSSYSCIVADTERELIKEKDDNGHYTGVTKVKLLKDIFSNVKTLLEEQETKRLS